MDLVLKIENFTNNKLYVSYGTRQQAMFTIIDEEFSGSNGLGRVNRMMCMVRRFNVSGGLVSSSMATMVVGIGDGNVGVTTQVPALRGKLMTKDTMSQCVVTLYED